MSRVLNLVRGMRVRTSWGAVARVEGLFDGDRVVLTGWRVGEAHCRPTAWSLRTVAVLLVLAAWNLVSEGLDFAEALPLQYGQIGRAHV